MSLPFCWVPGIRSCARIAWSANFNGAVKLMKSARMMSSGHYPYFDGVFIDCEDICSEA